MLLAYLKIGFKILFLNLKRLFASEKDSADMQRPSFLQLKNLKQENSASLSVSGNETPSQTSSRKKRKAKRRQTAIFLDYTKIYFNAFVKFLHKQNYLLSLLSLMVS
jgi:hypothetical protein